MYLTIWPRSSLFVRTPVTPGMTLLAGSTCMPGWLLVPLLTLVPTEAWVEMLGIDTACATGTVTLAVPANSTTPEISRRASVCDPPPSGTCGGRPRPRRSANASVTRQMTKCSQASQMTNAMTFSTASESSWLNRKSRSGTRDGHGAPNSVTSRYGTPPTIARIAISEASPFSQSSTRLCDGRCGSRAALAGWIVFTMVIPSIG